MMYQRKKIIPNASGTVLEIGIGPGHNLQFYDSSKVDKVIGVDPSNELNEIAKKKANKNNIDIEFLLTTAESIPLEDNSVDTAISTYTLCSIPNPDASLQEIKRVLKPGGNLLFSEHGKSPDKGVARFQNLIDFFWPEIAGGCHLNRNMSEMIQTNGFEIKELDTMYVPGTQKFVGFNYWGAATP
jgi:ubiquinone/menaquinone biosynthesis C-methylase UbiE|tara:strand:- start:696 stop:1250 length:555 start_codon:yes stop_codon:yes gene_type:complete